MTEPAEKRVEQWMREARRELNIAFHAKDLDSARMLLTDDEIERIIARHAPSESEAVKDARPHLVYEAYASLLRKAAEWDETDWEYASKFERHAVNAVLDLKAEREAVKTLREALKSLLGLYIALYPADIEPSSVTKAKQALSRTEPAKEQKP